MKENPKCPKCGKELRYSLESGFWCGCGWMPSILDRCSDLIKDPKSEEE